MLGSFAEKAEDGKYRLGIGSRFAEVRIAHRTALQHGEVQEAKVEKCLYCAINI